MSAGIAMCFTHAAAGILTIGIGFLLTAFGVLSLVAFAGLAGRLLPALLRKMTDFIQRLFDRGRREGARS